MKNLKYFLIFLFINISANAQENYQFLYLDTDFPLEERVNNLVSQMTLEEKIYQMVYFAPEIERLGIPAYNWWNECLHGVARAGYATVFPQSITIAGSWDKDLIFRVATAISDEARAKHHEFVRNDKRGIYQGLTFFSPNINIFRDPRWGRGHETYGEDPYLTGQLGTQFVKGLQGNDPDYLKVIATAKHYAVHSGPELLRHEFNANVSERDLRETYLPAFRELIVEGKAYSIMGAYNQFRDYPCCANPILDKILREEWGFIGYVVSDCWAVKDFYKYQDFSDDAAEASAMAVKGGTDLNCGDSYPHLKEAIERGIINENDIDIAVRRLFTARFKLGMFDPMEEVLYAQIPYQLNTSDIYSSLAREAARKSIVLLKNSGNILPISKEIKKIAVIGPNANNWEALIGNYNGIPKNPVTVLKGLKNKLEPKAKVLFAEGCDLAEGIHNLVPVPSCFLRTVDGKQGVVGEYFNNDKFKSEPVITRIDDNIDFYWEDGALLPEISNDNYSIRWTGYLAPPVSGIYNLGCWGSPDISIWVEGENILKHRSSHHAFYNEKAIELKAGKMYKFIYETKSWESYGDTSKLSYEIESWKGDSEARFLWSPPTTNLKMKEDALKIAGEADVVVLVMGLSQRLEGEEMKIEVDGFKGGDRTHLKLPQTQRELIKVVAELGKPTVLVLMNGSAMAVNWASENLDGIILAGYPGQQGGSAVADVLFGDYNPAGRLPVTYYKSVAQLPPFEEYDMKGRTYKYFTEKPLFPFGFGLSYTTFEYSELQVSGKVSTGDEVVIKVNVTNTGELAGEEVVQLYITDEKATSPRPIRQLEGFERIYLESGESKFVEFTLRPRQLSMINNIDKRVIEPGWFTVSVGGKQPGFSGSADAHTSGVVTGRFKVIGKTIEIK